jgi:hypothetical protein
MERAMGIEATSEILEAIAPESTWIKDTSRTGTNSVADLRAQALNSTGRQQGKDSARQRSEVHKPTCPATRFTGT